MKPAMHRSFVCQFLQIKLFLASLRGLASFATYNSRKTLTVLANLWECQPKLLTWDTLLLCNSNWPSSKGWTQRYFRPHQTCTGRISKSLYTTCCVEGWIKTLRELLCCGRGQIPVRGFRTSWWLSVCISFTLRPPCLLWAALLARHGSGSRPKAIKATA